MVRSRLPISRLIAWLELHPLSRAGALALAVAQSRTTGGTPIGRRIAAQVIGSILVSIGVAATLAIDIGVGPLDVFNIGLAQRFDLPLWATMWSVAGVLMVVATVLGNPPRPGTLITPFVIGASVQYLADLMAPVSSVPFVVALLAQATAVAVIGLGAGAIVVSRFGAGLGELISQATSLRFGRSMSATRLALESSFLLLGVAIGGPYGPGTMLIAVLIGPAVNRGVRLWEPLVSDRRPGSLSTYHHRLEVPEEDRALVHR